MAPHASQLDPKVFDEVRLLILDDQDVEGAIERLFEIWPDATRDEIVDVYNEIERAGQD